MPHDESGSVADLNSALTPAVRALASGERSTPSPTDRAGTFSYATVMRNEPPGWWGTDVWEQVNNYKGAVALAVRPIMTAFRGAEYKVLRRKPKSVQKSQGGRNRWSRDEDYEPVDDHPLCDIIRAPGGPSGAWSFGYECAYAYLQYLLTGNAAFWFPSNADGKPCQMFALTTTSVQVAYWPGASAAYPQGAYRVLPYATGAGFGSVGYMNTMTLLPGEQVRILREPDPLSRQLGRSRLQMGAMEIDVLKSINEFRWNYFDTGVALDTVVTIPGASPEECERIQKVFSQKHAGSRNARRFGVFGGAAGMEGGKGATVQNLSPNAKDLDFPNGFEQALGQVLAFFGVPKILAGFDDSSNYATYIGQKRRFYQECLLPEFAGLSEFLTKHLAEPWSDEPGEYVICAEPQVPEDLEEESKRKQFEATNNLITYNQYLTSNNYPPVDGGDVPLQIYLAKLQQQVAPPPMPGTDPNAPPGAEAAPVPGVSEEPGAISDEQQSDGDDSEQGTQDATLQAALAALGMGGTGAGPVAKGFDPNEARDDSGKWTSGGGASKADHEMTLAEFQSSKPVRRGDMDDYVNSWLKPHKKGKPGIKFVEHGKNHGEAVLRDESGKAVAVVAYYPDGIGHLVVAKNARGKGHMSALLKAVAERTGLTNIKGPYTPDGARVAHRQAVKAALSESANVPAEVLADYPDLAERFKKAAVPVSKPGRKRRQEGERWTGKDGKQWTKRGGKIVEVHDGGKGGPGASVSRPAGQSAPAPAQPQQPNREQMHAAILKTKGAKAFGFTAETLAKMHPSAVQTIAAQLGITPPEQHYAKHAAAVPVTPRSQAVLQRAGEWADAMAAKHANAVAQRLGIRPELAQKILAKAIRQVAEHALKNGGKASGTLKVGGQSVRLGVRAPQGERGGAKDGAGARPQPGIAKSMNTLSDPDGGFLVPPAGNMPRRKRKRRPVCDVVRKALEGVA